MGHGQNIRTIHIILILWEPSFSFLLFFFIYQIYVRNTCSYEHENDLSPNKEVEHLKKFENQFYRIFDNIEEYDYSNLEKTPTYRTGFNIKQLKSDPLNLNLILKISFLLWRFWKSATDKIFCNCGGLVSYKKMVVEKLKSHFGCGICPDRRVRIDLTAKIRFPLFHCQKFFWLLKI